MKEFELEITESRPLTDQELIGKIVAHVGYARQAMSQPQMVGNLNVATGLYAELEERARRSGDGSLLKAVQAQITTTYSPKEKESDAK